MAKRKNTANDSAGKVPAALVYQAALEKIDRDTKDWIRTAADQKAADGGMKFEGERGEYVCGWVEKNCYLYEGSSAGKPIVLIPYQREFLMRLFSWVFKSPEWAGEWIRRFRKVNLLCAKKNGKTPMEAAIGLFLTCADGEPGNNVYTSAKNGKQAQLAQTHAINMVEQSPNLMEICTINRTTLTITHTETRSRLRILSGDDREGAKANEGINGSILIDELHVYDREMNERTSRAGISRKEPLNIAVSTAGDDPSSYGFERTEYGRQVNEGKRNDPHFLHVEYSAPQKSTNEEIEKNLIEYGKAANPAWGYIVKQSEFVSDYEESKDKARELNRFKQYRLDLWIGSVSPWLNQTNWAKCHRPFKLEDLRGRECWLGIDLSRTRDMTAVILNFPAPEESEDGDALYLWPLFWCPRQTALKRRSLHPYLDWAEAGDLKITEGNVVDYKAIENTVCDLVDEHALIVSEIFFDQTYAEEMTQKLSERLGCDRTAVAQSLMTLSPLCKEFERRIDKGAIIQPGNPVLDWQVGHVNVWTDSNQNIRPVKPDENSGKSIDGILAILDTFAGVVGKLGGDDGPGVTFF